MLWVVFLLPFVFSFHPPPSFFSSPLTAFALGSCNDQYVNQSYWHVISQALHSVPFSKKRSVLEFDNVTDKIRNLFVWMGDAVYSDKQYLPLLYRPNEPKAVKNAFDLQYENVYYKRFRESTMVLGTWDDHDSCTNNGGGKMEKCRMVPLHKSMFLDFLDEPIPSRRRNEASGIFTSYTFGKGDQLVKMIVLDARSSREHKPGDLLGEEQWKFLEKELKGSEAKLHFIVSGIQVLSKDKLVHGVT